MKLARTQSSILAKVRVKKVPKNLPSGIFGLFGLNMLNPSKFAGFPSVWSKILQDFGQKGSVYLMTTSKLEGSGHVRFC